MDENFKSGFFDAPYGIASASLTSGLNAIATTGGYYHGMLIKASTGDCTAIVYDSASTTAGNYVDVVFVDFSAKESERSDLQNPVYVKNGITIGINEGGAIGVVFFAPKG